MANALDIGAGQVDLIDNGNDLKVVFEREIGIGKGLRLDTLCGVDNEERTLASAERTGNLVVKVDVSGGVDEIQLVDLAVLRLVIDLHGTRLDGDTAFSFNIHIIEKLFLHFAGGNAFRCFQKTVGKCTFAVVNMGNNGKISDFLLSVHVWNTFHQKYTFF